MRILYVTTISNTVNAFLIPHIKMLIKDGNTVDVAFNLDQEVNQEIYSLGCKVHIIEFSRSPFKLSNFKAYKRLKNLIVNENYDIVHTHTPVASACTRLACKNLNGVRVMYTAHGFHFYKGAPFINWLLYFPMEKFLSKYTDTLITINKEDYYRAKKSFRIKNIEYVPGVGLDINKFNHTINKISFRNKLGIPKEGFIILSVGELNKNKNHEVILKAISKIKDNKVYFLICGRGHLEQYLTELAYELGIQQQFKLLGFRNDVDLLYKISDIFAFPSKREGLGIAAIEAMASGLPLVTSNIHGIVDYSKSMISGLLCSPTDVNGFTQNISMLYKNEDLRKKLSENNIKAARNYDVKFVKDSLKKIYLEV